MTLTIVAKEAQLKDGNKVLGSVDLTIRLDSDEILARASAGASGLGQSQLLTSTAVEQTLVEGPTSKSTSSRSLEVEVAWAEYQRLIPGRRKLDAKRRRFIANAISLVGVDGVKEAFLGLSRSPWHNGNNPQRKNYLDVHYALRGKGDESDDSRIDLARHWAAIYSPKAAVISEERVMRLLGQMRYTASYPHKPEVQRARAAYRELVAAGFRVVMLEQSPWVRLER